MSFTGRVVEVDANTPPRGARPARGPEGESCGVAAPCPEHQLPRERTTTPTSDRDWADEVAAIAHALGIEYAPDTGPTAPGPLADMLRAIREMQDRINRLDEQESMVCPVCKDWDPLDRAVCSGCMGTGERTSEPSPEATLGPSQETIIKALVRRLIGSSGGSVTVPKFTVGELARAEQMHLELRNDGHTMSLHLRSDT